MEADIPLVRGPGEFTLGQTERQDNLGALGHLRARTCTSNMSIV